MWEAGLLAHDTIADEEIHISIANGTKQLGEDDPNSPEYNRDREVQ